MRVWWMAFISTHLIMLFSDIASIKFTIRIYLQPTTTLLTTTIIPHILIPVQSCPFCGQIKCECKTSTINACNIVDLHRWPYICRNIYAKAIAFLTCLYKITLYAIVPSHCVKYSCNYMINKHLWTLFCVVKSDSPKHLFWYLEKFS